MRLLHPSRPVVLTAALFAFACAKREGPTPEPDADRPAAEPAGGPATPRPNGDLGVEADVVVMESFPVQLKGTMRVENRSAQPISFDVGGCPVFLRAYGPTGGEPVYDQAASTTCIMILETVTLEPGGARTFETPTVSAADILGGNLPDGTYRLTVYLPMIERGELVADAGEVQLAIPR